MLETKKFWQSREKRITALTMVFFVAFLNYLTVNIAIFLKIPFFLDTWATSLGVMAGGLAVGLAGGILYNLAMSTVWGPSAWVWAFANIWIALITYVLWKKNWIDIRRPGKLFVSGLIIGLTDAIVVLIILFAAWGGVETYEGVIPTYGALLDVTGGNKVIAAIGEKLITEPVDKIVSIFIAAIVFSSIPKKYILTKRNEKHNKNVEG